jgi:hypothetical protein
MLPSQAPTYDVVCDFRLKSGLLGCSEVTWAKNTPMDCLNTWIPRDRSLSWSRDLQMLEAHPRGFQPYCSLSHNSTLRARYNKDLGYFCTRKKDESGEKATVSILSISFHNFPNLQTMLLAVSDIVLDIVPRDPADWFSRATLLPAHRSLLTNDPQHVDGDDSLRGVNVHGKINGVTRRGVSSSAFLIRSDSLFWKFRASATAFVRSLS